MISVADSLHYSECLLFTHFNIHFFNEFFSQFTGGTGAEGDDKDQTLNIFSLASGHLYERFLR